MSRVTTHSGPGNSRQLPAEVTCTPAPNIAIVMAVPKESFSDTCGVGCKFFSHPKKFTFEISGLCRRVQPNCCSLPDFCQCMLDQHFTIPEHLHEDVFCRVALAFHNSDKLVICSLLQCQPTHLGLLARVC